jgi:hypothetical protein
MKSLLLLTLTVLWTSPMISHPNSEHSWFASPHSLGVNSWTPDSWSSYLIEYSHNIQSSLSSIYTSVPYLITPVLSWSIHQYNSCFPKSLFLPFLPSFPLALPLHSHMLFGCVRVSCRWHKNFHHRTCLSDMCVLIQKNVNTLWSVTIIISWLMSLSSHLMKASRIAINSCSHIW